MKELTDLTYLRPLYKLCNFLAVAPPHKFGSASTPVSVRFRVYTFLHIAISVLLYVHSSYGRENFVYPSLESTVAVTDRLANLMLTAFSVVLRLILVFYDGRTMKSFFNKSFEISKQEMFECCSRRIFKIHFAIFNAYMVALVLFDAYFWISSVGLDMFQYYFARSFTYYVCNLSVFLIFHSVIAIKHSFASLSSALETSVKNLLCDEDDKKDYVLAEIPLSTSVSAKVKCEECYDLRKFRRYYNSICELVDDFNKIYGLAILMVIIVVITYVLNLTDLLLVYGVAKGNHIAGVHYGTELIILCGFWMFTLLIFTILLSFGCAGAISESERIPKSCFFWLNELPTIPVSKKDQQLKEELLLLSQQSTSRCPRFSAAGFFPVDFTLLGFIFGTVTSYIIISLQFIEH